MTRPNIDRKKAGQYLAFAQKKYGIAPAQFRVLGIRGYYLDSKGQPGKNDRGQYDDAIVVCDVAGVAAFNANTDPSRYRPGIATLCPGVHPYRPGNHGISRPGGGYPAFRPSTPDEGLPVTRDGQKTISRGIAINIHRGGETNTSSLGCQTIPPDQWPAFHALVTESLNRHSIKQFNYVLIEESDFRDA